MDLLIPSIHVSCDALYFRRIHIHFYVSINHLFFKNVATCYWMRPFCVFQQIYHGARQETLFWPRQSVDKDQHGLHRWKELATPTNNTQVTQCPPSHKKPALLKQKWKAPDFSNTVPQTLNVTFDIIFSACSLPHSNEVIRLCYV